MKITHKEYGDVDGVVGAHRPVTGMYWMKDGASYFPCDGWTLAQPKRVGVTGEIEIEKGRVCTYFNHGDLDSVDSEPEYHFIKTQRYNLPEGWATTWLCTPGSPPLQDYVKQYLVDCIIVEKDV